LLIYYQVDISKLSVNGYFLDPGRNYSLDLRNNSAQSESIRFDLSASNYLVKELDFYLEPWVFDELFGLEFSVNSSDLVLQLKTSDILPVVSKQQRDRARQKIGKATTDENKDIKSFKKMDRHLLSGGYLDYSSFSTRANGNLDNSLNLSAGGEAMFGETNASLLLVGSSDNFQATVSDFRWRYVILDSPWITEVSTGEHYSAGLSKNKYKGVKISNESINPLQSFDLFVVEGFAKDNSVIISDAEVELFQNGRLVDFTKSDAQGFYRFEVPLNYGVSDIKIKIYGPSGELIENDQTIKVPFNFLPEGMTNYNVEIGKMGNDISFNSSHDYFNVNSAVGIKNNLTTRFGLQYHESENDKKPLLYNSLSARAANDYLINYEWASRSFSRFSIQGNFRTGTSFNVLYANYYSTGYLNQASLDRSINSNIYYPFYFASKAHSMRMSIDYQDFRDRSPQTFVTFDFGSAIKKVRVKLGYRESIIDNNIFNIGENGSMAVSGTYSVPRRVEIHKYIRGLYIRSEYQHNFLNNTPKILGFQLVKEVKRSGRFNFGFIRDFAMKSSRVEIGLTYDFDQVRSSTRIRQNAGNTSISQSIRGSVGFDNYYKDILLDSRHQVGRSGVSVRMFLDENDSDTYDEGEQVLPGNALKIKKSSARGSIKNDIPRFTQLLPYKKYTFYLDESRILNPMLSPTYKEFTFVTDPNQYSRMDVPLRMTGIIDGKVYINRGSGNAPLAGLRVVLKNKSGNFEKVLKTFSDGSFYAMEIPPGEYELFVDKTQIQFLNATCSPEVIKTKVLAKKDGDFVEGLKFVLKSKN